MRREQIAQMNQHYKRYSYRFFLENQKRLGVTSLELWMGAPHFYLDRLRYSDCTAIRRQTASAGLSVKAATAPSFARQYQYAMPGKEWSEYAFAYFSNGIRAAAELGAGIVTVNAGWELIGDPLSEAVKRSAQMLHRLAEFAWQRGIVLALEPLMTTESCIADSLRGTKNLIRASAHHNLKAMVDTGAMAYQGETLEEWLEAFGEDLVHMHFVDAAGRGDSFTHGVWGDGVLPLQDMLSCMERYGYRGLLTQEIAEERYEDDPAQADRRNIGMLCRYIP